MTSEDLNISLTAKAVDRIRAVVLEKEIKGERLRIKVLGGGCQGFQYLFDFDKTITKNDKIFQKGGAEVVIDEPSLKLLNGSSVDFVEDLNGSYFKIVNPNATSSCGCGNSFSV
jgi:iron-sulfur cluster assembly accessory protein